MQAGSDAGDADIDAVTLAGAVMAISDHPSPVSPLSCPCTCVSQSEPELGRHGPMRGQAGESPDQMQRIHHTRTAGDSLPNYFKMSPDIDSK